MNKKQDISRRKFLKGSIAATVGASVLGGHAAAKASARQTSRTGALGIAMVTSRERDRYRVDLLSLKSGKVLKTFDGLFAGHAVVPVEDLNRFFVHGRDMSTGKGVLMAVEVDPLTEAWEVIGSHQLDGGMPLHWQPNRSHSLIQYNTIGDRLLHVLNTETLELESFEGGGRHSNMAFFKNDSWLVATDRMKGGTTLRVIDRASGQILSETPAGGWGHGVTVNDKTERAFVWASDGMHIVSLKEENLGQHLGRIEPLRRDQRSWFCWTPQGLRYSHDQTWNPGDFFSPWLSVVDLEQDELRRIDVPGEYLGTLGMSPDGKFGICGSHASRNVCLFDIPANKYLGKAKVGKGAEGFFDRDVAFSRDRSIAFVTDPPDRTLSAVDVKQMKKIGQIDLPARPEWMKVLTV